MSATLARGFALATIALAAPAVARAQAAPELRAGRWAAEASIGPGGESGALLRFTSPASAWLLGANFDVQHETEEADVSGPFPEETEDSRTTAVIGLRAGYRRYAGAGAALRPITGFGLLGGLARSGQTGTTFDQYSVGGYGELGAVYLFSSRVSLGAAGELRATYNSRRVETDNFTSRTTGFGVGGSVARVMATVYF